MATSVFGLFDEQSEAQRCIDQLTKAGIAKNDISVIANNASTDFKGADTQTSDTGTKAGAGAATGAVVGGLLGLGALAIPGIGPFIAAGPIAAALTGAGVGAAAGGIIGALQKAGVPEEEAHIYAEGVRRGGYLVSVTADSDDVEEIAEIMTDCGAVDIRRRGEYWKKNGFQKFDHQAQPFNQQQVQQERQQIQQTSPDMMKFQVVQEDLKVGKRAVERGGVRVQSYVHERPVEVPVELREEKVVVNRQAVDRPASAADFDTFKEGTMEVREMAEEAVVAKEARVVEEVTVGKTSEQRTETIRDTVRNTDVDVQDLTGSTNWSTVEPSFRQDFDTNYSSKGLSFEQVSPAYRFGYELNNNSGYQGRQWNEIEPQVRESWTQQYPQYEWNQYSDAVRTGFDRSMSRTNRASVM